MPKLTQSPPLTLTVELTVTRPIALSDFIEAAVERAIRRTLNMDGGRFDRADPLLLDIRAAAKLLSISPRTLFELAKAGRFLKPLKIGTRVLWQRDELRAWVGAGCPTHDEWVKMKSG